VVPPRQEVQVQTGSPHHSDRSVAQVAVAAVASRVHQLPMLEQRVDLAAVAPVPVAHAPTLTATAAREIRGITSQPVLVTQVVTESTAVVTEVAEEAERAQ